MTVFFWNSVTGLSSKFECLVTLLAGSPLPETAEWKDELDLPPSKWSRHYHIGTLEGGQVNVLFIFWRDTADRL